MDKLDTLTLFVRIVERGSFSAAAADLGFSRPVATAAIKALEASLGARLLQRTTRHVRPTAEGSLYYQRRRGEHCRYYPRGRGGQSGANPAAARAATVSRPLSCHDAADR